MTRRDADIHYSRESCDFLRRGSDNEPWPRVFVRNDRGPEPGVHLSLLSLMEELLLPHSHSRKPALTYEKKGTSLSPPEEKRQEGATKTRRACAREKEMRERERERAQEREREERIEREREKGWDRCTGVDTRLFHEFRIGRCGPCRQLLSGPHFKTWKNFNDLGSRATRIIV